MSIGLQTHPPAWASLRLFQAFAAAFVLAGAGALLLEQKLLLLLPFGLLLVFVAVMDYRWLYYMLFAALPVSTEVYFSDNLATDLPDEPLIAGLCMLYLLVALARPWQVSGHLVKHPITLLLLAHLAWISISALYSHEPITSFKFLIAKVWYVVTFYFLTAHIVRNEADVKRLFWWVALPFGLVTLKVLAHHALLNFGFREINTAVTPFFRNHVNYAAMLALFLPYVWFMGFDTRRWTLRWWLVWGLFWVFFLGVAFAYTRAAYVALFLAVMAYWAVRWHLLRWAMPVGIGLIIAIVWYLAQGNRYLNFVPSERTVAHEEFGNIVSATSKLEDVSTMERYYRWIAGVRMSGDDLWTGHGPNQFQSQYKKYTLQRFSTYVSDNPERSGIHNYFLMLLVEQGLPGLLLFGILTVVVLLLGESIYQKSPPGSSRRRWVMAVLLSTVVIYAFLLINDLLETDKVGSFFFFNLAVLVVLGRKSQQAGSNE